MCSTWSRSCVRGRSAGQAGTSPPPTTGRTASAPATSVPNGASWPGGEIETNRFGTDEFLAWCQAVDAEAYLAHSARDVDEAVRWVDYTNGFRDTAMTRRRRSNGREEPWRVRYWGVGN